MRVFVVARHAESVLNFERRVNGDPSRSVELTEHGVLQARLLGAQVAQIPLELCFHTRFDRTRRTAELALEERDVPLRAEPLFDDINVGELEGIPIDDYRAWKRGHGTSDPFPGGESLDAAARRYAAGWRALADEDIAAALVVCHEIPLRYLINASAGSDSLDGPLHEIGNALPFLFEEEALRRAASRIEELAAGPR
ncbi:MAG: histidine phosphatase family protein [Actinobacteria bacterium]|nr:histidine phosphatase family protein [Actinomycetota bacterium]